MKKNEQIERFILTLDHNTLDERYEALLLTGGLFLASTGENIVAQCDGCGDGTINNDVANCGCWLNIKPGCSNG